MRAAGISALGFELGSLVLALLTGCSGQSSNPPPARSEASAELGAKLYEQNCLPCHRDDGRGVPGIYPSLAESPVVNGDPVELVRWVLAGQRPKSMPAGRYPTQMLLFGWMKDQDAAAVLSYIRSHFGNSAPRVDAVTVAGARP